MAKLKTEKQIREMLEKVRIKKKDKINELFPTNYSVLCEYEKLLRWMLGELRKGERIFAL